MDVGDVPWGGLKDPLTDRAMDVSGGHHPRYVAHGEYPAVVGVNFLLESDSGFP